VNRIRILKVASSLPFLIVAGLFCLYLICGFFLVDPLAQKLLPWVGETKLASRLSAQQVKFNPLTFEVTVDGLKLAERNGNLLAGFDRLYLNIGTTGLFRWAWRIQDVQLQRPQVVFVSLPEGKSNWSALADRLGGGKTAGKKEPGGATARVLVDHIKIADGDIEFTDAAREGPPFKAALKPLGIELDGLSTLLDDRGNYQIAARLPEQGGTLTLKGDISLNPLSSKGEIALAGIGLAELQRADKARRNFEVTSGTLAAGLRYRFALVKGETGSGAPSLQIDDANLSVLNFALAPRGGAPLLELAEARIGNANLDLTQRRVEVASVSLTGGKLAATRDAEGGLDWQTLFAAGNRRPDPAPAAAAETAPEKAAAAQPWKIGVREIRMSDWAARFTDRGFAKPLVVTAAGFAMTAALSGEAGAKTEIEVGPVNAALGPVRVLSGTGEAAVLQRAALVDAKLSLAANRLAIEAVELSGLRTAVILSKDKTLNWAEILKKAPDAPVPAPAKRAAVNPAAGDKPGMDVQLARFSLDGIEVGIADRSAGEPVVLDITRGFARAKDLSLDLNRAVPIQAGFGVKQGGSFSAGGTIVPAKASGRLDLKLTGFALKPFDPYVNRFAKLDLNSGTVSTSGKLAFARAEKGTKVDFAGSFAVDKLALTEEEIGEAFFNWEKLYSDKLEFSLNPNRLHMNELVVDNPFAKVIIFEDKSINLKRILRGSGPAGDVAPKEPATAKAPPKAEAPDEAPAFPVAIDRVRITSADAEFADLSLRPQFGTKMHDLSGVVTGISNDRATTALAELDGKVDEFGLARIRGSIQPFRPTDATDMRLTFRNLEMTRLTPYAAKFAGRRVDSGKLAVDLEYKIKQRQLAAENKIVIDRIKLGERVDSPDALKLPLDLAIAILEDTNGVIDLDLPISGNLDDPEFSYGRIVWKAFVNVLTKVVTAPFRALGNLLGIRSEKLDAVEFDAGAATLLPPEREKLKEVGQALAKRPALTLSIAPAYATKADTRALQELRIRRDVAARMELRLEAGQEPGPVDTTNPRAQRALEDLYGERFEKQGGLKAVRSEQERAGSGAMPLHAEILERLTAQIPVTDAELNRLAQARGEAVKQALVSLGKMDEARIAVGAPVTEEADGRVVQSKMNLGTGK